MIDEFVRRRSTLTSKRRRRSLTKFSRSTLSTRTCTRYVPGGSCRSGADARARARTDRHPRM
eukprot:6202342-Pleurochrysis_carterae.AAC.1